MPNPPFLELQYYVGDRGDDAVQAVIQGETWPIDTRKISLHGAIGLIEGPEEVELNSHILLLRTEGDAFCGTKRDSADTLRKLGNLAYERFIEIAEKVQAIYGAILVEYSLEEPHELRDDARSLAFRNFYLGKKYINKETIEAILTLAGEEAYIKNLAQGIYISFSPEFNPEGRGVASLDAQERSVKIATILANSLTHV